MRGSDKYSQLVFIAEQRPIFANIDDDMSYDSYMHECNKQEHELRYNMRNFRDPKCLFITQLAYAARRRMCDKTIPWVFSNL